MQSHSISAADEALGRKHWNVSVSSSTLEDGHHFSSAPETITTLCFELSVLTYFVASMYVLFSTLQVDESIERGFRNLRLEGGRLVSNTEMMVMRESVTIVGDSRPRLKGFLRLIVGGYLEKDSEDATRQARCS